MQLPKVVEAIQRLSEPALIINGSADKAYDPDGQAQIQELSNVTTITIEGGDHSLEVPGNLPSSIRSLQEILQAITEFANR